MNTEQGAGSAERRRRADEFIRSVLGPARSGFTREEAGFAAGSIEGIEEGPRRSIFARRNRFRPGVLGNLLARAGQLRRVA
jgi:hypothetical protein